MARVWSARDEGAKLLYGRGPGLPPVNCKKKLNLLFTPNCIWTLTVLHRRKQPRKLWSNMQYMKGNMQSMQWNMQNMQNNIHNMLLNAKLHGAVCTIWKICTHTLALLNKLNIGRQSALWKWRLPRHAGRKHARSHAVCASVTITPLFFSVTSHVLVSFVTLLRALHRLSTVFLSVLSLGKICLAGRVMASGLGPPQLRRVRRGSSCFKRVQSISAGPFDTCCCRCCFAGLWSKWSESHP